MTEDSWGSPCTGISSSRHLEQYQLDDELPESQFATFSVFADWINFAGVLCCVTLAALAAGLTMGIVSLEALELRVKQRTGEEKERAAAARLLPLVEHEPRHQVLVTLLLVNSVANEALPLFLDELVPSWCAIVVSVTAVLLMGEILPSALFTGPAKLRIASALVPLVWALMWCAAAIAYPMAVLLDQFMPEETQFTTRQEVHALVEVERDLALELGREAPFTAEESTLVRGALQLTSKRVIDIMVPIERVFAIDADTSADMPTLRLFAASGFSRIPVRDTPGSNSSIRRYLLVKELIGLVATAPKLIATPAMRDPLWIQADHSLFELLARFKSGESHIAFVGTPGYALGIVTLEDVIEEIITVEIYDESDINHAARTISNFFVRFTKAAQRHTKISDTTKSRHKPAVLQRQNSRLRPRRAESSKALGRPSRGNKHSQTNPLLEAQSPSYSACSTP